MKSPEKVEKGQTILASTQNEIVENIKRILNIQSDRQSDITVKNVNGGILIGRDKKYILIDDLYKLDAPYNDSTRVQRRCDEAIADLADFFRIRAIPAGQARKQGVSKNLPLYRMMLFMQNELGGEGGWVTDGGLGFGFEEKTRKQGIAPPSKHVAQWQSFFVLTDDDVEGFNEDGDGHTYVNMRDDGHVHRSPSKDGRIFFTDTPAGDVPSGFEICGEMVGDPRLANFDTDLLRESVEWRPQLKIPNLDIDGQVYIPFDGATYSFPPAIRIPNSPVIAYDFGAVGKDEGWSAHYQPQHWLESYGLGFLIKYSADNPTIAAQDAFFEIFWKIANDGGDIGAAAGYTLSSFLLPVPAGSATTTVRYAYIGVVDPTQYIDKSLVIFRRFARRAGNVADTLTGSIYLLEVKMIYMTVIVPP